MDRNAIVLALLLMMPAASRAEEAKEEPKPVRYSAPEITVDIKNGERAKAFLDQSPWMKEMRETSLYEGLTLRFNPFLHQIGEEKREGWSGKLLSFLYDKILANRPLRLQYLHLYGLASPATITVSSLGGVEQRILKTIVDLGNKHKGQKLIFTFTKDGAKNSVEVDPVLLKHQRFAVKFHGSCFTIGRDPVAVAMTSLECPDRPREHDVVVRANLKSLFPSLYGFGRKFLGLGEWAETNWQWDGNRLIPKKGEISLAGQTPIGNGGGFTQLLGVIPASSWLAIGANLPDPAGADLGSMREYFNASPEALAKRNKVPVALLHLGSEPIEREITIQPTTYGGSEDGEPQDDTPKKVKRKVYAPLTALLIPSAKEGEALLLELNKLFSEKSIYEARYRKVCGGFVTVSNEIRAIEKIEEACARKTASLNDLPAATVGAIKRSESLSVLFQPANWLSAALRQGKDRLAKAAPITPDFKKAEALLQKIPSIHYSGKVEKSKISLEGSL